MHHSIHRRAQRCPDGFERAFFANRHHHDHGHSPFITAFMGGTGLGGRGFRSGRKLSSDDLQILLLALLALEPSHGYELIKTIEARSGGFYRPSPGMVYPALTYLQEADYASVEAEGVKKQYSITPAGRDYLTEHQEQADAILRQLERIADKMGRVREAFSGDADDQEGGEGPREAWLARRELRAALREKRRAGIKEARRIAEILKRATAEIRKGA